MCTGSLDDKIPTPLDRSKMRPLSSVPDDMTPAVLVACGSYSPPTVLHTRIFETARDFFLESKDLLKVDVIGGFISPVHAAYGKKGLAPMPARIEMVKRSLQSSDWVNCDEWETKQNEWTRTRLSLDRMHIEVNKGNSGKEVKVMLLCGADILDSMVTPGVWMESDLHTLLSRGIVCIKRSGSDPEKLINSNDLLYKYRNNIHLIREWVENNVSSTSVRRAVKRGMSIKYFVADGVLDYIKENKLYLE
jgi:nicotinate (nicotinamide) nucleotide adenylyltransferase